VYLFARPLPLSEFGGVVTLSTGGTLTPVHGEEFTGLKALLAATNALPPFLVDAEPGGTSFRDVRRENWPEIASDPGRAFVDETQLRVYLLDYLLDEVKDRRFAVLKECDCFRDGEPSGRSDYMVRVHGTWVPIEAKLNVRTERNLPDQLQKYIWVDMFRPTRGPNRGRVVETSRSGVCLVADQIGLYVTVDGQYHGCSAEVPAWRREALSHATAEEVRARLGAALPAR
jgi:hypothetical protein